MKRYFSFLMAISLFMTGCSYSTSTTVDEIPMSDVFEAVEVTSTSAVFETTTAETTVISTSAVLATTTTETTVTSAESVEETVSTVSTEVPFEETTMVSSSETTAVTTVVTTAEKIEETTTVSTAETKTSVKVSETVASSVATSKNENASALDETSSVKKVTETSVSKAETKKETAKKTEKPTDETFKKKTRVVLPVENIQQLPELPAGCEITATTIVMNYEGIKVDKMVLETYLPKMEYPDENGRWESPWNTFVGNPTTNRYGCYAPVIIETVEACLKNNKINSFEVVDISDSSMEELYAQIDAGHPVIVWATMSMVASKDGNSWYLQDGSKYTWRANEHCLALIGYDTENKTVILSDPYDKRGTVEYDANLFEKRYTELYKQALIIRRKEK